MKKSHIASNRMDPSRIAKRGWEWQDDGSIHGVHTYEGQLVWWERPSGPTGYMLEVAMAQAFEDFLASGPPVSAPPAVVEALQAVLNGQDSS